MKGKSDFTCIETQKRAEVARR